MSAKYVVKKYLSSKAMLGTIVFIMCLLFTKCHGVSYRDHLLIHVTPKFDAELDFFKEMGPYYNATFWRKPSLVNKSVEFSLSRLNFAELLRDTKDMDIDYITMIRDLQSVFEKQTLKHYVRRRMESFDWQNYYSVDDIYHWLRDLKDLHPNEIKIDIFGQSFQRRDLLAVNIDLEPENSERSVVVVEGGCHAREWMSPAFVTYMINIIVNAKNSSNAELKQIARSYIWMFIPLINPDGYAYSQTNDRLWRKNYHGGFGVDLNRNFGVAFGNFATKMKKDNEDYSGDVPFSEPETSALANYLKENSQNLEYYLSFHSYGQYIIIPYAYSKEHTDNFYVVKPYADAMAKRSLEKYKIEYSIGTAYDTVGYFAPGTSSDWVKRSLRVPYVLTIELPDQGLFGFALPIEQILPICEATMDSVLAFLVPKNDSKLRFGDQWSNNASRYSSYEISMWLFVIYFCFI